MKTVKFVEADDWIAMYVDDVKVQEGHSFSPSMVLNAVGIPNETIWAQDQADDDGCFPLLFEDVEPDDA